MFDFVLGGALPWILGIGASAVALLVAFLGGGSRAKKKAKIDDLDGAIEIMEKADEARKNSDSDKRTGDERLRGHNKLRD